MNYTYHQIARMEHEERNRSLKAAHIDELSIAKWPSPTRRIWIRSLRPVFTALVNLLVK